MVRTNIEREIKRKDQTNFIPQPKLEAGPMPAIKEDGIKASAVSLSPDGKAHPEEKKLAGRRLDLTGSNESAKIRDRPDELASADCGSMHSSGQEFYPLKKQPADKTLVQMVKNLDAKSKQFRAHVQNLMNQIVSTMMSWELFSDEQLADANQAMKLLQIQTITLPEDQKPMVRSLITLIGSTEVPMHIRFQIALNVYLMLKSRNFRRSFVNEPIELHTTMKPLYGVLLETCESSKLLEALELHNERTYSASPSKSNKSSPRHDFTQNLLKECINILCVLLSLEGNRYHIPGESYERVRLKQKAQDAGIIIVALHIMQKTKIDWLSKYIESEFLEKLEEGDIEYHQALSAQQYSVLHDILPGPKDDYISWQVSIEQILHEKAARQRDYRQKQEKFFKELREKAKEKEKEERRIEQEEIKRKREDAQ